MKLKRQLLLVTTVLVVVSACGGGAGSSSAPSVDGSQPSEAATSPDASSGGGSGGGAGITGLKPVEDGNFTSGQLHVEMTGDRTATVDATGNGFAGGGVAVLTFVDSANTSLTTIGFSTVEEVGLAVQIGTVATAVNWGDGCTATITRQDATGISGEFTCQDVPGIDTADALTLSLQGTFSAEH
jgi:hypothetical protein